MKRAIAASLLSTVAATGVGLSAAPTALAAPDGPQKGLCEGNQGYYVSPPSTSFKQASNGDSSVTGGPGVTLAITRSHSYTIGGSTTGTVSADAGVIFARVSASVSVTVSASYTASFTVGGTWTVPSTYKIGRLAVGTMSYSGTWNNYYERPSDCKHVILRSGTYKNLPRHELHFQSSRVA